MARTSRQQRRQRRGIAAGAPPIKPAPKPEPVKSAPEPAMESAAPSAEHQSEGGGRGIPGVRFVKESIAELKKVEWPTQQQVVSGTAVVLVACLLTGAFLYVNDRVWSYLVENLLVR